MRGGSSRAERTALCIQELFFSALSHPHPGIGQKCSETETSGMMHTVFFLLTKHRIPLFSSLLENSKLNPKWTALPTVKCTLNHSPLVKKVFSRTPFILYKLKN